MPECGAYGDRLGDCFGLDRAPALVTRTLRKTTIAATQLKCDGPGHGLTASIPKEDAFFVALQVRKYPRHDFWVNGKPVKAGPYASGDTVIYDVRSDPIANIDYPFHSVFYYGPRSALDMIADGADAPRVDSLRSGPERGIADPVVRHLTMALLPAFETPERASALFVDHVTMAVAAHVAHVYGDLRPAPRPPRGGLAHWQERRAKEALSAKLDGEVVLADLAQECGLSPSHFAPSGSRPRCHRIAG